MSGLSSIRSHASAPREIRFRFSHCREWSAEIFTRARFNFDKHQRVIVAAHNVDFAAAASTEIAEENFVTATLQEPAR